MDVWVLRSYGLHIVELPPHQDDNLRRIGGVANLLGMVHVVAFNGLHLNAQILGKAVSSLLGGVVEGAVTKGTGYYNRHRHIAGGTGLLLGVLLGFGAAGQQAQRQNGC